ncbi:MAG: efflux RND transporter permease subunit [Neomegalonema sp.]|nr:efflux RND transporter permease subunit [Neomegalonema sp.]
MVNGLISWAVHHARTIVAFILLSLTAGSLAYLTLPKEGSPNIDVPLLFVSVPFPGVSAADAERLIIKPLEQELSDLEGLKQMTTYATQSHAGAVLEFEFGWDKPATVAETRTRVDRAKVEFPSGAEEPEVNEINLSEFPILIVSLSGDLPERTLFRIAKELQDAIEGNKAVLEVGLAGYRDEAIEVIIDPLKLEAYDVTAAELIQVVDANNKLVAAGSLDTGEGAFPISLAGSFEKLTDITSLPVKVNGDRLVTLGEIASIRRTFEDATGTARFTGEPTVALQVKKRLGENIIDTVDQVRATVTDTIATWPEPLREAVRVDFSMDESTHVKGMVSQLENSVLTAVMLVMIVVILTLGLRSAMLVGLAVPCSFLLAFALLDALGMSVNNMVMFGMILAVGMLVDGAIVVTEYADTRLAEGASPDIAYGEAAKRMFWPVVSSTATTLAAFLPMLFWPGMPGQFMGYLPLTLIFVLSASLLVALIYLPVVGSLLGYLFAALGRLGQMIGLGARKAPRPLRLERRRSLFGAFIHAITGNPVMPFVALALAVASLFGAITLYGIYGKGTEFFVKTDPERAIIHVRARGNLSLSEKDALVRRVEQRVEKIDGIAAVFSFAGEGGLEQQGGESPVDSIGQVQIELAPWSERGSGDAIIDNVRAVLTDLPGGYAELALQEDGPKQGKPIQIMVRTSNWSNLHAATAAVRAKLESMPALVSIDDTRPLPGIEWQLTVDRTAAGRFDADVQQVGALVQLVTRGATIGTYRPDDSDEELDIRVRFPEDARTLTTLDQLKLRTTSGLVPLSNFVTRNATQQLSSIQRRDGERFFLVRADVMPDANVNEQLDQIGAWIDSEDLRARYGAQTELVGDQEEQEESQAFLQSAFAGALGLMFIILLAQFNSLYNAVLVLSAVVLSVAGVLLGMLIMGQTFSIIMTGTGIVALAGIVVNNNIVLIDTYQQYAKQMPRLDAIVRTAEDRIRPVLLTTVTTIAGLLPMMFATSIDFFNLELSTGAPTALWWVQLATAVVFGLAFSTLLTLIVTPAALAARIWAHRGLLAIFAGKVGMRRRRLDGEIIAHQKAGRDEILWTEDPALTAPRGDPNRFRRRPDVAAE